MVATESPPSKEESTLFIFIWRVEVRAKTLGSRQKFKSLIQTWLQKFRQRSIFYFLGRLSKNFREPSKLLLKGSRNKGLGGKGFNDHPNEGWVESRVSIVFLARNGQSFNDHPNEGWVERYTIDYQCIFMSTEFQRPSQRGVGWKVCWTGSKPGAKVSTTIPTRGGLKVSRSSWISVSASVSTTIPTRGGLKEHNLQSMLPDQYMFQRPSHLGVSWNVKIFSEAGSATFGFKNYPGYGWVERCGSVVQEYLL